MKEVNISASAGARRDAFERASTRPPRHNAERSGEVAAVPFRAQGGPRPDRSDHPGLRCDPEEVEELGGRLRHEGLHQDADRPQHLGRDVEHASPSAPDPSCAAPRAPARRNSGSPPRPRPRSRRAPYAARNPPSPPAPCPGRASASHSISSSAWRERAGRRARSPSQFLAIIESERWARLPRSLARSALMRSTIASWRVVAVLAERHLAQEEVAQLVDAVGVGKRRTGRSRCRPTSTSSRRG